MKFLFENCISPTHLQVTSSNSNNITMAMENATTILTPRSTAGDERYNYSNQDADDGSMNSPEIIVCGVRTPVDLMTNILAYVENDRRSLNNLSITCKGIYQVIQDPTRVTKPWPLTFKRPFSGCSNLSADDEVEEGSSSSSNSRRRRLNNESSQDDDVVLIFSNDKSRFAVFKDDLLGGGILEIWDQSTGFIGKVQCDYPNLMWKPVFSPNNDLLVLEPIQCSYYHEDCHAIFGNPGIRICHLPPDNNSGGLHPPTACMRVTQHDLYNYFFVNSVTFLDDNTLAFTHFLEPGGVTTCSIISSSNGEIITSLSEPQIMIPPPTSDDFTHQTLTYGKVTSYSGGGDGKNILAFVHDSCNSREVAFYDCHKKALFTRPIPPNEQMITDLVFSPDGKLLVVAHKTGGLALFDCSADEIEDIRQQPRLIKLKNGEGVEATTTGGYFDISFSPGSSSSKIITACIFKAADNNSMTETTNKSHQRITQVIDIEEEEIISDGWDDDSSWRLLVS